MRKAGSSEALRFHNKTNQAIVAAVQAQKDAESAHFNEGLNRQRLDKIEGFLSSVFNRGFWGRMKWLFTGK